MRRRRFCNLSPGATSLMVVRLTLIVFANSISALPNTFRTQSLHKSVQHQHQNPQPQYQSHLSNNQQNYKQQAATELVGSSYFSSPNYQHFGRDAQHDGSATTNQEVPLTRMGSSPASTQNVGGVESAADSLSPNVDMATNNAAGIQDDESQSEGFNSDHDESADDSQEAPERNMFMDNHNSRLQAMHDLFERRQLNNHQLQMSQELNPISIGLDPVSGAGSPFNMPPFPVPNSHDGSPVVGPHKPAMSNADNIDQGLGPAIPFGLSPLPHLLGFQNPTFDGPQRGDQSAHSNHHSVMPSQADPDGAGGGGGGSQKVWPKIFRFTDGRINLSEFEKQKKIRLSNKNSHSSENHIESAPIMFDGRQLKRKSFLILHGGIFSR